MIAKQNKDLWRHLLIAKQNEDTWHRLLIALYYNFRTVTQKTRHALKKY